MAKRSTALLALIYNHLLQHGLSETARKLQQESGENFNSHKKTLEKIYKHWNKESKKKKSKKKNDAQSKKTCQQDPVGTEASGDKGDEVKKAVLATQDKTVSVKRTVKKVDDPEAMDSTKKPASKAKAAPRSRKLAAQSKPSAAEIPAVSAQGIDDPDGEEEIASSAPVTEPPLKPTRAATTKSKATNSRAAKQPKSASAKTAPAAGSKTLVATNSTAVVTNDVHDGSESSDETDIEKQKAPAPAVSKVRAPRAAKTTAAQTKNKRGSAKTATLTPTSKVRKTSSTRTKEDIEDLNTSGKQKVPNQAGSKVKAAAPRAAKTTAAQTKAKKERAKTAAVTLASKGRTRVRKSSKTITLENSKESNLDSEFVPSTLEATAPSNVLTSNQKAPVRPVAPQSMADDSSESSEMESEEEPVKQFEPKVSEVPASQDKEEPPRNETVTTTQAIPRASEGTEVKIASPKKTTIPASPAKVASAHAPKPEAAAQDSESSDESDSEPEMKAVQVPTPSVVATKSRTKPTAVTPASQSRTAAVRSPAKMVADESSEESDSDDAPSSAVKAPGLTSPKLSAPIPTLVPDSDDESESSDSSDSELEPGQKIFASQNKTAVKPPTSAMKTIVTGKIVTQSQPSQDSSETSESEEDEPQAAAATPQQRTPALDAKGKREVFTAAQPDEESSSEESEDDSNEPVNSVSQKVSTPAVAASKLKYTIIRTAVSPLSQGSAAAVKIHPKMAADETSEESDSDDEPCPVVKTPILTRGTPSPKPSAPIPAHLADSDADSESSDSSDSEENAGLKDQASQTKITANLSSSVVKAEVADTIAQSKPAQDSSETSESEEEKPRLSVARPQQRQTALVTTPQQRKAALPATPQQGEAAFQATPQQRKPTLAAKGMQGIPAVAKPDESSSEESEDNDEPGKSVPTPALSARNQKSITKPTAVTPASQSSIAALRSPAKMAADESSEDSDSDDEVEAPAQIPAKATVIKGKSALAQMPTPSKLGTVKSAGKTPVVMAQATAKLSSKSPEMDSYKEVGAKGKMELVPSSQKTANKTAAKVSADVPGTAGVFVDDASELENSQSLLQATPKKRKLSLDKKYKTTPVNDSTGITSGKKSKVKTQLEAKPTPPAPITPAGLLDSEEETVLALLEGRSPKKARLNKNSKSGDVAAAPVTVQDSSVLERSLPRYDTSFPSEDEDFIIKSPPVPEHSQFSAKKSSKKRKSASEDSLSEEKGKKAKKEKKEEKLMADVAVEATSPKSSKKEKSEKKKDGNKMSKESKKLMQSLMASFGESTDSGVGLQSKPKKKKVKGDKE
ncbi:treacle protein isoform X2 [Dendrobates tinctorius]|uniref:treacle protein isoform X2 n=1 Tax=Dendrobates tinctorius TaxID=92724 RepID=UPI003CCA0674